MNEKNKVKILIALILGWVIIFALRLAFFQPVERHVPLKYTGKRPGDAAVQKDDKSTTRLPALLFGKKSDQTDVKLAAPKNIFAELPFKPPPPPPPKPEPPPLPPKQEAPPPPHPLEGVLEGLQFMGKATKNGKIMVFLAYDDEVYQVSMGRAFYEDQLKVTQLYDEEITINIIGTKLERKINLE